MKIERMDIIAQEIDEIMMDLLIPAKMKKEVDEKAFFRLENIMNDLKKNSLDNDTFSKKLVGVLFFLYVSLSTEAQYCKKDSLLFLKTAQLESDLNEIFGI